MAPPSSIQPPPACTDFPHLRRSLPYSPFASCDQQTQTAKLVPLVVLGLSFSLTVTLLFVFLRAARPNHVLVVAGTLEAALHSSLRPYVNQLVFTFPNDNGGLSFGAAGEECDYRENWLEGMLTTAKALCLEADRRQTRYVTFHSIQRQPTPPRPNLPRQCSASKLKNARKDLKGATAYQSSDDLSMSGAETLYLSVWKQKVCQPVSKLRTLLMAATGRRRTYITQRRRYHTKLRNSIHTIEEIRHAGTNTHPRIRARCTRRQSPKTPLEQSRHFATAYISISELPSLSLGHGRSVYDLRLAGHDTA